MSSSKKNGNHIPPKTAQGNYQKFIGFFELYYQGIHKQMPPKHFYLFIKMAWLDGAATSLPMSSKPDTRIQLGEFLTNEISRIGGILNTLKDGQKPEDDN